LAEDPKWELAILATVQGFYEKLLQDSVEGEVPVPAGLETVSLHGEADVGETLGAMRRWLRLLDMAISPAMLRRAFNDETDPEIAEAMLRYFVRKKDHVDSDQDKTDIVSTFLYRHPRVPGQWEQRGYGLDGSLPLSPFEIALIEILADADLPALAEEHLQTLRRFDSLEEQVLRFQDLNALLESGIIQTVRQLKQTLDESFFHPGVLATVAPYNATFGQKFDDLFRAAVKEIKVFSEELEEQGGTILGSVDGVDVTVDHVRAMDENMLLRLDYGMALEKFRRVSKLKQTLEQGRDRLRQGFWIVIFPEGTRIAPGARGRYHVGGAWLAIQTGAPVVPIAHNAGYLWGKNAFVKHPGRITVSIGEPIAPDGMKAEELSRRVEDWIENEIARLPDPRSS